jgi:hypothetical protein
MFFVFLNSPGHIHSTSSACKCFFVHIKTLATKRCFSPGNKKEAEASFGANPRLP